MPDSDGDGWADFTDCAPNNARINPGVDDKPDAPSFRDTNCDGIDGNTRRAVFVSPLGDDDAPGTRAQPKQTLAAAVAAARSQKKDVYATRGIYHELLFVANAVGVYGGYDTSWRRSTSNVTRITGGATSDYTTGAIATNVTARTSVQLLTLTPAAPTSSGASSYGLRGINSGGLVLDHVTARAGSQGTEAPVRPEATDGRRPMARTGGRWSRRDERRRPDWGKWGRRWRVPRRQLGRRGREARRADHTGRVGKTRRPGWRGTARR